MKQTRSLSELVACPNIPDFTLPSDILSEIYFYSDMQVEQKNVVSDRISDNIPSQMKILNMIIPILMRFHSLVSN